MGNDSSQYGRVEGAVSGCRPAGPQNVGQGFLLVWYEMEHFSVSPPNFCVEGFAKVSAKVTGTLKDGGFSDHTTWPCLCYRTIQ